MSVQIKLPDYLPPPCVNCPSLEICRKTSASCKAFNQYTYSKQGRYNDHDVGTMVSTADSLTVKRAIT